MMGGDLHFITACSILLNKMRYIYELSPIPVYWTVDERAEGGRFLALDHCLLCHFVTYMTCVEDPIGVYSMQFTEPRTIPVCDGGGLN